jgi:hypothetical protein
MDTFNKLTTGAKVVLIASVALFIVSWFNWYEVGDLAGDNMWGGVGFIAGLLLIALLVWQGLRLANVNFEVGISSSMVTGALAVLILIFTFIRFIDKPGSGIVADAIDRTFWAWIGLALAIVIVIGAWMSMQAAGESFGDMKKSFSSVTSRGSAPDTAPAPPASPPPASSTEGARDTSDDARTT